jgi:Ca2+-transporting ATPase
MNTAWSQTKEQVLAALKSNARTGLTRDEAGDRLRRFGPNRLQKERTVTFWGVFKEEVTEPMILLLLVVGIVYALWGELRDAVTILVIILLLVLTEISTEYRAKRAIAALRRLSPPLAPVVRGGVLLEVPGFEIVQGDIILLESGVRVPADARLIDSYGLQADESALTGESVPVDKEDRPVAPETPLADRINMVFAGTTITRGRGRAVVTAGGMETELGRITGLVLEAKEPKTPLQLAMKQLAGLLVGVAVFFSVIIPCIGLLQGKPFKDMILTGLSMAFATIPEELPIVITMVLGVGALALSRRHVLVRRLRAAETLGAVTAIVADKTGTLTENRMSLGRLVADAPEKVFGTGPLSTNEVFLLEAGVLTSNVKRSVSGGYAGDPMEVALWEAAEKAGLTSGRLHDGYRLRKEYSFDNRRKMMSAAFETGPGGGGVVFAKGAPEAVLAASSRISVGGAESPKSPANEAAWLAEADRMAAEGMRVIAFASKQVKEPGRLSQEEAECELAFAGLAGFLDPVRSGVPEAVQAITEAGIRTIVVSGDHPFTVKRVAAEAGIPNSLEPVTGAELERMTEEDFKDTVRRAPLFARTTAEQKLKIVAHLHEMGEVVAVTGDGINDAPALRSADIGIAMGETGTEVAREAATMVLTDDSFISIADGVREGRKIFDNLTKGITYYLCVKVALVLTFLAALILSKPFPFAPIQIILLELFMDLAASATFVAEPIERGVMTRRPRNPKEPFVNRLMLRKIARGSLCLAGAVVINYLYASASGQSIQQAQTLAFATWLVGHVFLALAMRSEQEPLWRLGLLSNMTMIAWGVASLGTLVVVTTVPQAREALKLTSMDLRTWLLALGVPFVAVFWMELFKGQRTQ